MAEQSPSSLFLEPGQGFWGALKERHRWLTNAQIQALLPQIKAMNPNITDIGTGYPGVPYAIPYIPKPPGYVREYDEPGDVQEYGEEEAGQMRAFFAKNRAERDADLDAEYDKTSRLARLARAFGANVSIPAGRTSRGTTKDPAKGIAKKSANKKFFEDLFAFSKQVGGRITSDELSRFMTSVNAGEDQMKALKETGYWDHLNLGKLVPMYAISEKGELDINWVHSNDAAAIQIQRNAGYNLDKTDATLKRSLGVESAIVTATNLVMDAKITNYKKWQDFRTTNKELLDRSPEILSAVKALVPDEIWKTGDMETLFKLDDKGKITAKDFDKGTRAYNTALGPLSTDKNTGGWSKTLEATKANEGLKFDALMAELLRDNPETPWSQLKIQILNESKHIRMDPKDKADAAEAWWSGQSRKEEALSEDKSLLGQYLDTRPTDMDTLRIDIGLLNNGKGVSPEAEDWFWKEMNSRYPYPNTEPRTLWNPGSGAHIDVENYWEKNQAFADGFTSDVPVDLTPMSQQRLARRHIPITKVLDGLDSDAETWWYQAEELSLDQAKAFFNKHKRGMKRFTEKGERLFVDEIGGRVKPLMEKHDKSAIELGTIIQSARQGEAGHVALLNTVIRMYDELGAVRESDINLVNSLAPWRDQLSVIYNRLVKGEITLLSPVIVDALEAIAYSTWRMKALYTQEQLAGIHEDFDDNVLPSAYPLGETVAYEAGPETLIGEGTKISWTKAAGNRVTALEEGTFDNPYTRAGRTPLDVAKYVLANKELIKELEDLGATGLTATSLEDNITAEERARKWGYKD
jgi:hypothetical protein